MLFYNDWNILESSINMLNFKKINLLEIGCGTGITARDIIDLLSKKDVDFTYYGIDPLIAKPHNNKQRKIEFKSDNFCFIKEFSFSDKALVSVPLELHWIFIDGCHCKTCIIRDFKNYAHRLVQGGALCFHDCSPGVQDIYSQDYPALKSWHDSSNASQGIQTLAALKMLDLKTFNLVREASNNPKGGIRIYSRL